ncbi:MAG: acyl-CoA dehydrogenase family protein [Halioglobus sp.]
MNLDFSEEQLMLRHSVARLCDEHSDSAAIRTLEKDSRGFSQPFWQGMAEMGLCGLSIDESYGGIGLGCLENVIVHEEMGRTLAPSPHLVSSIIAASLLQDAGTDTQRAEWLQAIASGELVLVPAWQEAGASADLSAIAMRLESRGDTLLLRGEKIMVPFANSADKFLVPVKDDDGQLQIVLVNAKAGSLRCQPNHADQNLYAVNFDAVEVVPGALLNVADLTTAWDTAMMKGQIALAAQAVAGATAMLQMANDYAKEREQFGQPIGAFQAIAHYLADRATEIEGARYLVYQAAWACDAGESWEQLALMAKLQATAVFRRTTVTGVQVHGGMGFSSEADPQLYYRRAKHLQLMHWDPRYLEQRIAAGVFG